jgi:hypothetical protein
MRNISVRAGALFSVRQRRGRALRKDRIRSDKIGFRLCGIADEPFARFEVFVSFAHLGPLPVTYLQSDLSSDEAMMAMTVTNSAYRSL